MAKLNFPNPVDTQIYEEAGITWTWNNTLGVWSTEGGPKAPDLSYTYPGGVKRTIQDRLTDFASVKDFGAKGDGSTDDTSAIQAAINTSQAPIYFPAGKYKISGTLYLPNNTKLIGCTSGQAPTDVGVANHASMLEFDSNDPPTIILKGTDPDTNQEVEVYRGTACITSSDPKITSNICIESLTIRATVGTYDNVFLFPRVYSSVFYNIRAKNDKGGIFKSVNNTNVPSWTNRFFGCTFGCVDGLDAYVMDTDCSDSYFTDCYFSAGRGVIDRSTGGNLYKGCHFERTRFNDNFAAVTITRSKLHQSSGACQKTFTWVLL